MPDPFQGIGQVVNLCDRLKKGQHKLMVLFLHVKHKVYIRSCYNLKGYKRTMNSAPRSANANHMVTKALRIMLPYNQQNPPFRLPKR